MKPDNILDKNFSALIQTYQMEKEGVEWMGRPKPDFKVFMLEYGGDYNVFSGPSSLLGIILGFMAAGGYMCYMQQNWTGFAIVMLIGLMAIIFPDVVMYIRRKKTRYVVTPNRVFFNLWWWGKESTHEIDLADVVKITWQEYKNKRGTIHFMTANYPGFNTYDFQISRRRDYPTFEMVDDAVALAEKLEALRQERRRQRSASLPQ